MKKQRIFFLTIGICAVCAMLIGILMLFAPKSVSISSGVIVICLSLCSGLIAPNPLSFIGLLAGIGMLFLPPIVVGIGLIVVGSIGAAVNAAIAYRQLTRNHQPPIL